ncbi:hypothetical protein G6F57_020433 [Rhizopus arrhizus]|nr:hypothetical protein G6F57_020433 [Rhizopus arrhizus]
MTARSAICVPGLAIVSVKTMRVLGWIAARTWAESVASTKVISTPSSSNVPSRLLVLPNTNWLDTRWSPRRSSVVKMADSAAIPVAKLTVPLPPSMWVSLASSAVVVGVPWRAYVKPALPWNTAASSRASS